MRVSAGILTAVRCCKTANPSSTIWLKTIFWRERIGYLQKAKCNVSISRTNLSHTIGIKN